jgi:hypothetical protein
MTKEKTKILANIAKQTLDNRRRPLGAKSLRGKNDVGLNGSLVTGREPRVSRTMR